MGEEQQRNLKYLVHTMLFMLSRQEFHVHQISSEKQRLIKSIHKSAPDDRKIEHMKLIREYQLLLAESSWYLTKQQAKLKKYLRKHPHLKGLEIYQQAGNVLKEMHTLTK
ncbi:uncharacterized protein LOC111603427 [Drosophila hydei]|uniref:Uncharacterized protein LOC111603427 n=1 Tax=Drosophila hydei TaxID=7224 RepID=A0A6J1MC46_DROHY|nr:uncharacterized protein LOC111603427 [Drosophila hydei]